MLRVRSENPIVYGETVICRCALEVIELAPTFQETWAVLVIVVPTGVAAQAALETSIATSEKRLAEIERELIKHATNSFKLNELFAEQARANERMEKNTERWLELSERAEL